MAGDTAAIIQVIDICIVSDRSVRVLVCVKYTTYFIPCSQLSSLVQLFAREKSHGW